MDYSNFLACLTSGSWDLRGHTYRFLAPLKDGGYFTVDGFSDAQLNFEIDASDGALYLYLNVDREEIPEERYRVLDDFNEDRIRMVHEIRSGNPIGDYEFPTEVSFIKSKEKTTTKSTHKNFWDRIVQKVKGAFATAHA